MRIFSYLYNKMIQWSGHPHAPYYLAGVSFAESSMFPVPPDVMLISMSLAKPTRAWHYAMIATASSVLGGMLGYLIGMFGFNLVYPWIVKFGYLSAYQHVQAWFHHWGVWVIFLAGFSPIPYKLFTIGAGAVRMSFLPFVLASIVGRSMRFFLVSSAMYWGGDKIHRFIHRYIDRLGWFLVIVFVVIFLLWETHVIKL